MCARRSDGASVARRIGMHIQARGRMRNARAAIWFAVDRGKPRPRPCRTFGPGAMSLPTPNRRRLCRMRWHPYPTMRRRNALQKRCGSIGQWRDEEPTRHWGASGADSYDVGCATPIHQCSARYHAIGPSGGSLEEFLGKP